MYLGNYKVGEKVWIPACTHKFETGQEIVAAVTGYYLKVGAAFGTKVALTFNIFDAQTGVYYAEIDTAAFDESNYVALVEATVDTVIANQLVYFGVRDLVTVYMPD